MTAQIDSEGAPHPSNDAEFSVGHFGSSVYGGRPTFTLARREGANGGTLTLYELLPDEQAAVRRRRLERANRRLSVEPFEEIFPDSEAVEVSGWSWSDWVGVKVACLSGSRLRAVLSLLQEELNETDFDASVVTSTGEGDLFLPETVGVRFALGFAGVKPIQRVDRMRAFARGIARMSDEECYYWYAKCRSPSSPSGEKALRVLLADHID